MVKIAHFIDSDDPGGAEMLVVEICKCLNRYGFQLEVLHFGNTWLKKECDKFSIPSIIVPGHKYYKSAKTMPIFSLVFKRFLQRRNIDILHSHLFGSITGACITTFLTKIPHIGTIHDTYTIEEKKSRIRLILLSSLLKTRLITVSEAMKNYLRSLAKFPKATFETIYNGVDLEKFSVQTDVRLRSEVELEPNDITLISVGRLVGIKGHEILVEAFDRLLKSKRPIKLLIVGDGPNRKNIESLITNRKLDNKVKILGFRHDIPQLLRLSDCFVLSSHSEGLSYSIIEAMASGLPLVVTDVGGNRELVIDGECGYLAPPNDPTAFAERLQLLIDNEQKRKQFGRISLKLAREKFSLTTMLDKYVNIYNQMIN